MNNCSERGAQKVIFYHLVKLPDNDYVVYQGMNSNGTLLNMNVKLQNSFVHDSVVCCVRYSYSGQYLATVRAPETASRVRMSSNPAENPL